MARINIEEEAHKRVSKLAGLAKCSDREALGTVSYLWGESQDILKVSGSKNEIIEWCRLFNLSDEEVERWISALQKSRFISHQDDGRFLIHGNEIQIQNRIVRIAKANKGAKSIKKKWKKEKALQALLKGSPRPLGDINKKSPSPAMQGNAMQGSAVQSNAVQSKAMQKVKEVQIETSDRLDGGSAPEIVDLTSKVWLAYRDAYSTRYKESPVRNAKVNGQIKQLARRLGSEAPDVVAFFVSHNKSYYVSKLHEIGACLADCEALRTQWATGRIVTQAHARGADNASALADQLRRIGNGELS